MKLRAIAVLSRARTADYPFQRAVQGALMTSLRRVRDQVREMRAELAPQRPQRLIAVSTVDEAGEVRWQLRPGGHQDVQQFGDMRIQQLSVLLHSPGAHRSPVRIAALPTMMFSTVPSLFLSC